MEAACIADLAVVSSFPEMATKIKGRKIVVQDLRLDYEDKDKTVTLWQGMFPPGKQDKARRDQDQLYPGPDHRHKCTAVVNGEWLGGQWMVGDGR